MKQNSLFKTKALAAASIAALAIGLIFAGCALPMLEVEGAVDTNAPAIANPVVTAEALSGGVKLSWPPIIEAAGYQVWRSGGAAEHAIKLSNPTQDFATGEYVYLDLVGSTNPLTAGTEYSYTVIAVASASTQNNGKWTGKVTTTTIPARGDKVAKPSAVAFTFSDTGVEVTITAGTDGPAPAGYDIELYRKTASGSWNSTYSSNSITGTSGELTASLSDGEYVVWAYGAASGGYYSDSDVVKSEAKSYTVLLSSGSYPDTTYSSPSPISTAGGRLRTLTGYMAYIDLSSIAFKAGVTYSLEPRQTHERKAEGNYPFSPWKATITVP